MNRTKSFSAWPWTDPNRSVEALFASGEHVLLSVKERGSLDEVGVRLVAPVDPPRPLPALPNSLDWWSVAASSTGVLAFRDNDRTPALRFYDLTTGTLEAPLTHASLAARSWTHWHPSEPRFSLRSRGAFAVWDFARRAPLVIWNDKELAGREPLAFGPSANEHYFTEKKRLALVDWTTGKTSKTWSVRGETEYAETVIDTDPSGRFLALQCYDFTKILLLDSTTGATVVHRSRFGTFGPMRWVSAKGESLLGLSGGTLLRLDVDWTTKGAHETSLLTPADGEYFTAIAFDRPNPQHVWMLAISQRTGSTSSLGRFAL